MTISNFLTLKNPAKKNIIWIILFGIIIFAAILRLWQLGSTPPSLEWDEVALGYDAYSFIHTARDEFGNFLPPVLRSFDDYKPAFYAYLTVPFVYAFDLTAFAVRLPSAVFGILAVLATFFLVKELFKKDSLALLSAFIMAISPWSVHFSRIAFEANVADALNIFAVLFFLKGLKKPWLLSLASLCFSLSIYTYQSEKVFVPLLFVILMGIYWKKFWQLQKRYIGIAVIVGVITMLPMVIYLITNHNAFLRVQGTAIFSNQTVFLQDTVKRLQIDKVHHDYLGLLFDNRRITYFIAILSGYLSHFNLNWLFITGDIARHHAPYMGLLYLWNIPFLLIGIYMLLFGNYEWRTKFLIFSWFLLAPLPASITTGVPHAVRTLNFLPTFQIFTALGMLVVFSYLVQKKYRFFHFPLWQISGGFLILIGLFNLFYYLDQNFVQLNYYESAAWKYGYVQAIDTIKPIMSHYKKIVVSDRQPLDKSYMFFLFYFKYPPDLYQGSYRNDSGGFSTHHAFDKFDFRPINWQTDVREKNTLFIGKPDEFPDSITPYKIIYFLNGRPAIKIIKT